MTPSSQGPVGACRPYKNSIWIMTLRSQKCLWRPCWGSDIGETEGGSRSTSKSFLLPQGESFLLPKWGLEEEEGEQTPPYPLLLHRRRLYSTSDQTRNNSPVWQPPVLKNIGKLGQENKQTQPSNTSITFQLKNCHSLKWVMERPPKMGRVLQAQVTVVPNPIFWIATGQ